ncbi:hypothetical protein [Kitasatospora sp. KL5]|uniref:hypothetical protein n=1 Tax=Kitasatospora sp. KL5 TaxID=3425125 RepID=UPI003D6F2281
MSRTSSAHRAVRSALVGAGAVAAVVLSGGAALADGPSASPVPTATRSAEPTLPAESGARPSAVPSLPPVGPDGTRRSGAVPRGGAQTGEADTGGSPTAVVLGSALALAGAAGIGTAVVRRRRGSAQA